MPPFLRFVRARLLAGMLLAACAGVAGAASKMTIAVQGDPAPGGGVFAGPGFTGWPAAAGDGWVAFRGQVSGGTTSEAMVVAHLRAPSSRTQVASIGQPAPGGGTFRQFVGRPAVNAQGDVAFLALLNSADDGADLGTMAPAGIFLARGGTLSLVATTGEKTAVGTIDLTAPLDPSLDTTGLPERSPTLNDGGDVAFLAVITDNPHSTGGIFLAHPGVAAAAVVEVGDPYDGGAFTYLGQPALNNVGLLAFRGKFSSAGAPEDGMVDGIFTAGPGNTAPAMQVGEGALVGTKTLTQFEDGLALNDDGKIAFMAGPIADSDVTLASGEESPGVLLYSGGMIFVVSFVGRQLRADTITSFRLGPAAGSTLVPPAITPDGQVAFFASLENGSREAIAVWHSDDPNHPTVLLTAGPDAAATPAGGRYAGTDSAPAIDATGAVAFLARVTNGVTSQAVFYRPPDGNAVPIVVGEATPSAGYFAGQAFSGPALNDAGDVVFRAFLARGPASVGIFHYRAGTLETIVRAGDPAPGQDGATFLDLVGQPSVDARGAVAFVAQTSAGGLGIFVADGGIIRRIVGVRDAVPKIANTTFKSIGVNPSINGSGDVAFRATMLTHPATGPNVSTDAIFISDAFGLRPLVRAGDVSPDGPPFLKFRDPTLTDVPSVVFRATFGTPDDAVTGLFVVNDAGLTRVAREKQDLGGGISLGRFTGDPLATPAGQLAFVATRSRLIDPGVTKSLGPSILLGSPGALALVVAQDMPGPVGGTFRNLTAPALNAAGHVAFRGSFLPFTGGTGGVFLATETGIEPYLLSGETTSAGGRFSAFGGHASLNAQDDLAFTATVSSGSARNGVFLASRARLGVRDFALRVLGRNHDRLRFRLMLKPGRLSVGYNPTSEPMILTVSDGRGLLWTVTVPGTLFSSHAKAFLAVPRRKTALARQLGGVRTDTMKDGTIRISAVSARLDLTDHGQRPLQGPYGVMVQLGDDAAARGLPCHPGRRSFRCHAP